MVYEYVDFKGESKPVIDKFIVIDANGQVRASIYNNKDTFRPMNWLDNERITLNHFDESWKGVYIVNPFKGYFLKFSPK